MYHSNVSLFIDEYDDDTNNNINFVTALALADLN